MKNERNYREIEEEINSISKELDRLKSSCENRMLDDFPSEVIQRIIDKGNKIKLLGEDVDISERYMDYVVEHKDVNSFFQTQIEEYKKTIEQFYMKKNALKSFSDKLAEKVLGRVEKEAEKTSDNTENKEAEKTSDNT